MKKNLMDQLAILPTDYRAYGGTVERWSDGRADPDCSMGCAFRLRAARGSDLHVCTNRDGPRWGLMTFEHQAGRDCFSPEPQQQAREDDNEENRSENR